MTGCSTGFGNNLIQEVLNHGDYAIATARDIKSLKFENITEENHLVLELDVSSHEQIELGFSKAVQRFGRINGMYQFPETHDACTHLFDCFSGLIQQQWQRIMRVMVCSEPSKSYPMLK